MTAEIKGKVAADLALMEAFFAGYEPEELRNPHVEDPVSEEVRLNAVDAAVLIALTNEPHPRVVMTRRSAHIRFGGTYCFPGGRTDDTDTSAVDTALRESWEEIFLAPESVRVLGVLGDYYTQAGFHIVPVVGVVEPDAEMKPNPSEVATIEFADLAKVLDSDSYQYEWRGEDRAHVRFSGNGISLGGPTVSIMVGLLEAMVAFVEQKVP